MRIHKGRLDVLSTTGLLDWGGADEAHRWVAVSSSSLQVERGLRTLGREEQTLDSDEVDAELTLSLTLGTMSLPTASGCTRERSRRADEEERAEEGEPEAWERDMRESTRLVKDSEYFVSSSSSDAWTGESLWDGELLDRREMRRVAGVIVLV